MPVQTIPIQRITIPPGNREQIDEAELQGLAETMKKRSMLQAITVRPVGFGAAAHKDGKFSLVTGERRLRAAMLLGWQEIEANVQDVSDEDAAELRLIENTQRVPLSAWEEGDQVLALDPALTIEEVAIRLGRTPAWVAVRRAIGRLIQPLKQLVRDQDWPMGHLPLLARFPQEQQPAILEAILDAQKTDQEWSEFDPDKGPVPSAPTLRELQAFLSEYQRLLSSAPWKKDDAQLLPKAGACNVCPKRSSAQSLLFPELSDAKSDRCLDEGCWNAKQASLVHLNVQKLQDKGMTPILLKRGHESMSEEAKHALGPVNVGNSLDYVEVKKGTPGAKPAVIVAGAEAGQVKYVKPSPSAGSDESAGSANDTNGHTNGKAHRAVNQETGAKAEPSTEERIQALKWKRQCRAGELWSEKLETLKPPFKGCVDALLIWFGTWEKKPHRNEFDWDEFAKAKVQLNQDGWEQLRHVFDSRMKRFGPMEGGAAIWREALSQAKALSAMHALEACWKKAVDEIGLTKALKEAGVKDDVKMPPAKEKEPKASPPAEADVPDFGQRMRDAKDANEGRLIMKEFEDAVNAEEKAAGRGPSVGKITPTFIVGFSVLKPNEIKAIAKKGPRCKALVDQWPAIEKAWAKLLNAEATKSR